MSASKAAEGQTRGVGVVWEEEFKDSNVFVSRKLEESMGDESHFGIIRLPSVPLYPIPPMQLMNITDLRTKSVPTWSLYNFFILLNA